MIRPLVFQSQSEFQYAVQHDREEFNNCRFVIINHNAYEIEQAERNVTTATDSEVEEIRKEFQDLGDTHAGNKIEAQLIKRLLFPAGRRLSSSSSSSSRDSTPPHSPTSPIHSPFSTSSLSGSPPRSPTSLGSQPPTLVEEGSPAPRPEIKELKYSYFVQATTPEQKHLDILALQTPTIAAYDIGPASNPFLSPVNTNIRVREAGEINLRGYYAPMNTLSAYNQMQEAIPQGAAHRSDIQPESTMIVSGINPKGSSARCEGFWMLTQQLKMATVFDCSGAQGASFELPYYPPKEGDEYTYGCMHIRRLPDAEKPAGASPYHISVMNFEVKNTLTEQQTQMQISPIFWHEEEYITPAKLQTIVAKVQSSSGNSTIVSEHGHRQNGLIAAALLLTRDETLKKEPLTEQDKKLALNTAIITTRKELGPNIVTQPKDLMLLRSFIDLITSNNQTSAR